MPLSSDSILGLEFILELTRIALVSTGILLTRAQYVQTEKFLPAPSIRVAIAATHDTQDVIKAARVIKECAANVFARKD